MHDENGQDPEELQGDPTHPLGFADEFNTLGTGIATARLARANIDSISVTNGTRIFGIDRLECQTSFCVEASRNRALPHAHWAKAGLGMEGWFGVRVFAGLAAQPPTNGPQMIPLPKTKEDTGSCVPD